MTDSMSGQLPGGSLPGKRQRLVDAAMKLLHEQGVVRTTLADIAKAADVPAGNVYYYFKTKDDIVAAVIEAHEQHIRTTLAALDTRHRSPKGRLKGFVREVVSRGTIVAEYGCPFGSLCSELDKRGSATGFGTAALMRLPIEWAEEQFRSLGRADARDLAMDLLAAYEGHALLANTMQDPDVLTRAGRRLHHWIDAM